MNRTHRLCPMLGFNGEEVVNGDHYPFYVCRPIPHRRDIAAAVWDDTITTNHGFAVALFLLDEPGREIEGQRLTLGENSLTDVKYVDDALQAQGLVFHLIETATLPELEWVNA